MSNTRPSALAVLPRNVEDFSNTTKWSLGAVTIILHRPDSQLGSGLDFIPLLGPEMVPHTLALPLCV